MKKKTLVVFARPFKLNQSDLKKIKKFFKIFFYKKKNRPNEVDIIKYAKKANAIIAGGEIYTSKILAKLDYLEIISRVGIGLDNIDLNYANKRNIKIYNTPDAPSNSTAEFAFTLIISAVKKISLLHNYVKQKKWNRLYHSEFSKITVGIIGYGRIGSKVARLLKDIGFGKILINEIDKKKIVNFKDKRIKFVTKEYIYKNSNVLTLHIPLNIETNNMINSKVFKKFKKNTVLVNTSRGPIVNINDLKKYIKLKKIEFAMLDVMPVEPYFGNLIKNKNIVITPHNASMSYDSRVAMEKGSINNILNWVKNNYK